MKKLLTLTLLLISTLTFSQYKYESMSLIANDKVESTIYIPTEEVYFTIDLDSDKTELKLGTLIDGQKSPIVWIKINGKLKNDRFKFKKSVSYTASGNGEEIEIYFFNDYKNCYIYSVTTNEGMYLAMDGNVKAPTKK